MHSCAPAVDDVEPVTPHRVTILRFLGGALGVFVPPMSLERFGVARAADIALGIWRALVAYDLAINSHAQLSTTQHS